MRVAIPETVTDDSDRGGKSLQELLELVDFRFGSFLPDGQLECGLLVLTYGNHMFFC